MKAAAIIRIMQLVCLLLMLASLYFKATLPLIVATVIMVICVALSFYLSAKQKP
ncbi:hypothetical protein LI142_17815 [Eubacterium limosum]|uniref:Uncharacterized protein n=1 Tax=Eubacterium limosum TaxID=1736 RepID=A0ABT5URF5_EUBLI|nr:hypothetical protein [Eubacterium limosum]MCB6571360.1 hypothetical protein [Eubacterium limosum]MDE1470555.1 hypothetical protein [Eubacterium limosum]